jgi:dienelactone hydrolase
MMRVLGLLLLLMPGAAFAQAREVTIPEADGLMLQAKLYLPAGTTTAPGVVALHGCAGPLPKRDDGWARLLAAQGHPVLLPDSFGSRGLGSQCRAATHGADAYGPRRGDALAAATWLQVQAFTPKGGILLLGWSDGGTTVLATISQAPDLPAGLIRGGVAFYPACTRTVKNVQWHPSAALLILMGAADDWTPPAPCQKLAAESPQISITLFPGAYHDFDVPNDPVHTIKGLPYTKNGGGMAHAGENMAARIAAQKIVPQFFAGLARS